MAGIFEYRRLIIPQIVAFLVARRGLTSGNPDESGNDYRRFFLSMTALVVVIGLFVFWDVFFDRWLLQSEVLNDPMYWMNRRQNRFGSFFLNPNYLGAFSVLVFPALFVRTLNEPRLWPRLYSGWDPDGRLLPDRDPVERTHARVRDLHFAVGRRTLRRCFAHPPERAAHPDGCRADRCHAWFSTTRHEALRFDRGGDHSRSAIEAEHLVNTVRAVADYPVAGIGFGEHEFRRTMDEYGFSEEFGIASFDNPHNSYLQMAIYAGIPALLFFVLANLALLWRAFGLMWRDVSSANSEVVFGLSVGLMGFLAAIYPDMHMFTVTVAPVYWIYFGLLLSSTASRQVVASVEPVLAPVPPAIMGCHSSLGSSRQERMRIVILTSETPSNVWLVNQILSRHDVVGMVIERRPVASTTTEKVDRRRKMIQRYGLVRTLNKLLFNRVRSKFLSGTEARRVKAGFFAGEASVTYAREVPTVVVANINEPACIQFITDRGPDLLAVCGTTLLKPEVFTLAPKGTINIHTGITPDTAARIRSSGRSIRRTGKGRRDDPLHRQGDRHRRRHLPGVGAGVRHRLARDDLRALHPAWRRALLARAHRYPERHGSNGRALRRRESRFPVGRSWTRAVSAVPLAVPVAWAQSCRATHLSAGVACAGGPAVIATVERRLRKSWHQLRRRMGAQIGRAQPAGCREDNLAERRQQPRDADGRRPDQRVAQPGEGGDVGAGRRLGRQAPPPESSWVAGRSPDGRFPGGSCHVLHGRRSDFRLYAPPSPSASRRRSTWLSQRGVLHVRSPSIHASSSPITA